MNQSVRLNSLLQYRGPQKFNSKSKFSIVIKVFNILGRNSMEDSLDIAEQSVFKLFSRVWSMLISDYRYKLQASVLIQKSKITNQNCCLQMRFKLKWKRTSEE